MPTEHEDLPSQLGTRYKRVLISRSGIYTPEYIHSCAILSLCARAESPLLARHQRTETDTCTQSNGKTIPGAQHSSHNNSSIYLYCLVFMPAAIYRRIQTDATTGARLKTLAQRFATRESEGTGKKGCIRFREATCTPVSVGNKNDIVQWYEEWAASALEQTLLASSARAS